jgi:site-specific DNA recombinase
MVKNLTKYNGRYIALKLYEHNMNDERIRYKIAVSKKKGMWMGGVPPLGRVQDRKLAIIENEAEAVRAIFRRYAELGSVR